MITGKVKTTWPEMEVAKLIGGFRTSESQKGNFRKTKISDRPQIEIDTLGVQAEMALAKFLGVYWDAHVNRFGGRDVAGWQVRGTDLVPHGRLVVRKKDSIEDKFVLVLIDGLNCTITGCMAGVEAMVDKYVHPGKRGFDPAWFVPQGDLHGLRYYNG